MSVKTKAPASACRVIVTVSGGVADVLYKPKGVEVCILDYDVDGEDADRLDRDPDGLLCCMQKFKASEKIVSHNDRQMVRSAARSLTRDGHPKQRWQCTKCRRIVHCSDESLAGAGTPFCPNCDRDVRMI